MAVSYGASEIYEGLENIRLAYQGTSNSGAYNPLRDTLFSGNQTVYDTYGAIGMMGSMGVIQIAPAYSNTGSAKSSSGASNFQSEDKLNSHYDKHAEEFNGIYNNPSEYLNGAQDVMKNGYKIEYTYKGETRTGYVQYMGNTKNGDSKFSFVGTNADGFITTYHTESGKSFWKMINGENEKTINPIY